jgi:predicted Zn-dependent protease
MANLLLKLFGIVLSFFVIWFLLSRIDWMGVLEVNKKTDKTEEKIGQLYVDLIKQNETIIKTDSLIQPIKDIIEQIKTANDIYLDVKLHVINKDDINAFAIPDDNLVLFTGLIEECQSPEELAGVLGHELAHMEKNHVMKKLVKEVGLSVLLSMTSGGNGDVIRESFKSLTSSAYDRSLESEADQISVEFLQNADIDSRPFAEFLFRLSLDEDERLSQLQLMSSHPASEERAKSILDNLLFDEGSLRPLMSDSKWKDLKENLINQ